MNMFRKKQHVQKNANPKRGEFSLKNFYKMGFEFEEKRCNHDISHVLAIYY